MNRVTVCFLACVASLAAAVIAFSCAEGGIGEPCLQAECVAGCQASGFANGFCGSLGCECTAGADADADVYTDVNADADVRDEAASEAPDTEVVDDGRDDGEVPRDDGETVDGACTSFPLCNTTGSCSSTTCSQCCYDNYGMGSGTCSGSCCRCGGGDTGGEEGTPAEAGDTSGTG